MATTAHQQSDRVNARLDRKHAAKLAYLKAATGMSASEIVKRGIDLIHDQVRGEARNPFEILSRVGFIGAARGPTDLSVSYKDELLADLEAKHGHR